MKIPPQPINEQHRLEILRQYNLLDTQTEQALDELATLAAHICQVPISLISLIDENRQWFKSKIGISVSETPRDISFCAHAINEPDIFIVSDATKDERFSDNPLVVSEPHIRFYAGVPLVTKEDHALGTLCIIDRIPRQLNPFQQEALRILARQVMTQLELRHKSHELGKSERFLRTIIDSEPECVKVLGSDGTLQMMNPAGLAMIEADSFAQVAGQCLYSLVVPEHRARFVTLTDRVFNGESGLVEFKIVGLKGTPRWLETRSAPLLDEHGQVSALLGITRDITARKQAEIASRQFAAIVESSKDAIIGKNLNSIITSWNTGAETIFGCSASEMIGTSIMRLIPSDRQDEENFILGTIRRGENVDHFETLRQTKNGNLINVSITASPIKDVDGNIIGVSKIARDITERKKTENALLESNEKFHQLVDNITDVFWIRSADMRELLYVSPAFEKIWGRSVQALYVNPHEWAQFTHPDDRQRVLDAFAELTKNAPCLDIEYRILRPDDEIVWIRVRGFQVRDTEGKLIRLTGIVTDISKLKQAEVAIRASEGQYRTLFEYAPDGILIATTESVYLDANASICQMLGYKREELIGLRGEDIVAPSETPNINPALETIKAHSDYHREWLFRRKDGSQFPADVIATMMPDGNLIAMIRDITERKKLEQQFLRAQRMESVGSLAGGIAHDLNNVLAPILMSVEMLKEMVNDQDGLAMLRTLQVSAQRGANLVQQVLSFARGVKGQRVNVDLTEVMQDLLIVIRDTFPKSIDLQFYSDPELWTVTGDSTQLHQIFLNLCVNARDAMPNGGTLSLHMENIVLDETYTAMNIDAHSGPYVMVKVIDTGTGIPVEIRDKVFDPFFTTKPSGQGTGLGLSTTLAIVKSHDGFIHLYSEVGRGTKFKIYLPANTTETRAHQVATRQTGFPHGNGELILVVDDEAAIRDITRRSLERFGYRVMLATNGAEAVAAYAEHKQEIAVVLTDMTMPIMDGPALIIALKSINPYIRIIGSSGMASNGGVAKAMGAGMQHFIPKPYTSEALLRALQLVLHGDDQL